ncbi:hypothetical protein [Novosphingobium sp. Leaf2]|uniref:hypothetical protein n=1 Tax=Novosphingobium sp. Leaf2 TaxID=1735670 RepID=UPI0006F875BB|nr:hypothetical protein [Novosphingobium sp. Leaf2]KQM13831.1 hypothetical protein ASE49_12310 [Novosphingobium sp. Leaf2]
MVSRLFLTLLALLTGLAAQLSPADARVAAVAEAQLTPVRAPVVAKVARAPIALAQLPEPGLRNTRRHAPLQAAMPARVAVVTVYTGIDRSRQ